MNIEPNDAKQIKYFLERIQYWENIFGFPINLDDAIKYQDADIYIKLHYAKQLKKPSIMARILGYIKYGNS